MTHSSSRIASILVLSFAIGSATAPSAQAVCTDCGKVQAVGYVEEKGKTSGVGMVAGGVLGGVLGHQIGSGRGNTVATVAGAAGGAYVGNTIEKNKNTKSQWSVGIKMDSGQQRTFVYSNQPSKVLIHIARDEASQLGEALNEVESLLRHYRDTRQNARVEVVINGKGLELVRIDTSAFAERIQKLQSEFDNLTFAACQNTIDRLKREQGIIVRLLPGVVVIDSGVAELTRRQNQGWAYIQV